MAKETKYNMNHKKRGTALVINIQKYDASNPFKLKERVWSVKDVVNLKKTLNYLEFEVILSLDSTKCQIEEVLQEQASLDHTHSDCFFCVVMSHGNEDKIVTSDNKEISFEEIVRPIKSCKSLENKPKLFFLQACRGDNEMEIRRANSRPDSGVSTSAQQETDFTLNNISDSNQLNRNKKTPIYTESDLLVYNATLPKHYAYGTVTDGTYFIESICEVLNEAFKNLPNNLSLSQMVTKVNKRVKERENEIQLADPINRLTKEVYFTPKNVSFSEIQ